MSAAIPLPPDDARYAGFERERDDGEGAPPPDGFENLIGPLFHRRSDDAHEFLIHIEPRHLNHGRVAHGGLLAALGDVFCSRALWHHGGRRGDGFVTVSLTHEFIGAAPADRWLRARCTLRHEGGSLVFIDCEMLVKHRLVGLSRCVMKKLKSHP